MDTFFRSNPGMSSRIAHHLDFPDYPHADLLRIADRMLEQRNYHFGPGAREAFEEYIGYRITQEHFANARSVRNALDRARLRQASVCSPTRIGSLVPRISAPSPSRTSVPAACSR